MEKIKSISNFISKIKIVQLVLLMLLFTISYFFILQNAAANTIIKILLCLTLLLQLLFLMYDFIKVIPFLKDSEAIRNSILLDDLTSLPNRSSCDAAFKKYSDLESIKCIGCALITITTLVSINESKGRDAGNQIIIDFCEMLNDIGKDFGFVGRNGGNEFLLIIENCSKEKMEHFFELLNQRIGRYNVLALNDTIGISYQYILNQEMHYEKFHDIIAELYHSMHNCLREQHVY